MVTRGRPHRVSPGLPHPGGQERIGWLLRVNRRYGADGRDVRLASFAAALTAHGCAITAPQVSRWESGAATVPHRAVTAYERVLGLPHNGLVSVVDAINRSTSVKPAPSRLERPVATGDPLVRARAEDLLDRALFGGDMAGGDWDELTVLLTAFTEMVLPGRLWDVLTQRLISDQLIADGDTWRQCSESTQRLFWLPAGRRHMVAACAAVVRDPSSQIVIEPLAILDVVDDPAVTALLMEQLTRPVGERALCGALRACAGKIRLRQLTPAQLRTLTRTVLDLLTDTSLASAARPLAASLLGHGGVEADPDTHLAARIADRVLSRTESYADAGSDGMLARIVSEMLFDANSDTRLRAAQLAGATPFRAELADACCAELRKPAVSRNPELAGSLLDALPFVATGPDHRRTAEIMVVEPGLPMATAGAAAWSIAHLPGSSADPFWAKALQRGRPLLRGLIYALGIAGRRSWLTRIGQDPDMPGEARTAARWWSNR